MVANDPDVNQQGDGLAVSLRDFADSVREIARDLAPGRAPYAIAAGPAGNLPRALARALARASDLLLHYKVTPDLVDARGIYSDLTRALGLTRDFVRDLDRDLTRVSNLSRDLTRARDFARDLYADLGPVRNLELDRTLGLARDFARDLDGDVARARDLCRNLHDTLIRADEFTRALARDLDRHLRPVRGLYSGELHELALDADSNRDLKGDLDRALYIIYRTPGLDGARGLDRDFGQALTHTRDRAFEFAYRLDTASAAAVRVSSESALDSGNRMLERKANVVFLGCLARLLPARERGRFVAEARGNLACSEGRWQRIDILVTLAIGTPRLALVMRHNSRRGRT
jgi:hypothetical protein